MGKKKHQHQKKERGSDDEQTGNPVPPEKVQQPKQQQEQVFQPVAPKKVSYCPVCSLTFELCKYGKEAPQCAAFLYKLAPAKVTKYHPDFKPEMLEGLAAKVQQKQGEKEQGGKGEKVQKGKEEKGKTVKDKYIVIEMKNRGRKHFITTVSGLNNFNVDAKDVAKKCSKKFAVSCSAIELGTVQLQGDNLQNMREFLLAEYKQLKKKYIIDKEEFSEKAADETAKKKEARKREEGVIKEEPEEEEKPEQVVKDRNMIRMELMKKADEEQEDD